MRPSQLLRSGGGEWKPGQYMSGTWGAIGSMPQKGIVHYGIAQNRLSPLAGTFQAAVFNTFRRTRNQILYWSVPLVIAYQLMNWATDRNHYLNSKAGIAEFGEDV